MLVSTRTTARIHLRLAALIRSTPFLICRPRVRPKFLEIVRPEDLIGIPQGLNATLQIGDPHDFHKCIPHNVGVGSAARYSPGFLDKLLVHLDVHAINVNHV